MWYKSRKDQISRGEKRTKQMSNIRDIATGSALKEIAKDTKPAVEIIQNCSVSDMPILGRHGL